MMFSLWRVPWMRSWGAVFLLFGVVSLVGCDRSLNLKETETLLKEELSKKGVGSLKQVSCPSEGLLAGKSFTCTGVFESGIGFSIPVQHLLDGDKLKTEIPSIKGMLNMDQVMKTIRDELKLGDRGLDCSITTTYRMVTLGSTFECTIAVDPTATPSASPKPGDSPSPEAKAETGKGKEDSKNKGDNKGKVEKTPKEPDKIEISIAPSGDVTWQRLIATAKPLDGKVSPVPSDGLPKPDVGKGDAAKTDAAKTDAAKPGDQKNLMPPNDKSAAPAGGSAKESDEVEYDS